MEVTHHTLSTLAAVISEQLSPQAVPDAQWLDIIALAGTHGLAPMLLHCIQSSGSELPGIDLVPLKEAARLNATRYAIFEAAQAQVETAFREAGLPVIWLKGIALAHTLYPDSSLRPMRDLDVLVPYQLREEALKIARIQGYSFNRSPGHLLDAAELLTSRVSHHYCLVGGPAHMVLLELHSHLVGVSNSLLPLEEMGWFWERVQPCRNAFLEFQTLDPTAHLLYLCAHAEIQHAELYLLRYFDLHQLVALTPPDWSQVVEQAVVLHWTYAVERALQTCMDIFSTPVPVEVIEQLRAQRSPDEDTTHIDALKAKGMRWVRMQRVLSALGPMDRLRIIGRVLLPSSPYMRARYEVAPEQPVWPYYLSRWLEQVREVFYAMRQRWTYQRDKAKTS